MAKLTQAWQTHVQEALRPLAFVAISIGTLTLHAQRPQILIAENKFPPALIPDLIADPSIVYKNGIFYCYATTDGYSNSPHGFGPPVVWTSPDFLHWSFHGLLMPHDQKDYVVAPGKPVEHEGKLYLYPTVDHQITPMTLGSMDGPLLGSSGQVPNDQTNFVPMPIQVGKAIDAQVFKDDNGQTYMVWAQRGIGRVAADMITFDGPQQIIPTKRKGYSEGPFLFKRAGVYYYLYTLGAYENYEYAYMFSYVSPLGPWQAPADDIIAKTNHAQHIFGPGHGSVFRDPQTDRWYLAYLEYGRGGSNRQVLVEQLEFLPNGTIKPLKLTGASVGALRPVAPEINLGQFAVATASSIRASAGVPAKLDPTFNRTEVFSPANAIDESNGSRWMAQEHDPTPWLQLDFGRRRRLRRIEINFVKPTAGHIYRVDASIDAKHWQTLQSAEALSVESPNVVQTAADARYLRVYILRGAPGIWEIRVTARQPPYALTSGFR